MKNSGFVAVFSVLVLATGICSSLTAHAQNATTEPTGRSQALGGNAVRVSFVGAESGLAIDLFSVKRKLLELGFSYVETGDTTLRIKLYQETTQQVSRRTFGLGSRAPREQCSVYFAIEESTTSEAWATVGLSKQSNKRAWIRPTYQSGHSCEAAIKKALNSIPVPQMLKTSIDWR